MNNTARPPDSSEEDEGVRTAGRAPYRAVTPASILDFLGDRAAADRIDNSSTITGPAAVTPGREGCFSFCSDPTNEAQQTVESSQSSLIFIKPSAFQLLAESSQPSLIAVSNPRREFARAVAEFFPTPSRRSISPRAIVDAEASIGPRTTIEPGAYIAPDVTVGSDCHIGANAVLLEGSVVGDHTSIGPNTTIGHVGFGYAREDDGSPVLIPHSGGVSIGSHVDIGANTCIDRGTLDDTIIEDLVKIDNLVHIAHNCHVGKGAFVIATAILCGGVRVGPRAWIAPNASVREQLQVGADATVGLASTVLRDVPEGATVVGSPARQVEK